MRFKDRVALITAAGSGIGRATAEIATWGLIPRYWMTAVT
jgi:NADP-dependent 3-hydroxy acid dehydrogenase YdfG